MQRLSMCLVALLASTVSPAKAQTPEAASPEQTEPAAIPPETAADAMAEPAPAEPAATVVPEAPTAPEAAPAPRSLWRAALALGAEVWIAPTSGTNGFLLLDAKRRDVSGGTLHLLYNTDTILVGLEDIRLADGKLALSIVARGEALMAGLNFAYYQRGDRLSSNGFFASYAELRPSLKWHVAARHSLELGLGARKWFFGRQGGTDDALVLPPEAFVFEPRVTYNYWAVSAASAEWDAHRFYPRITGLTFGVTLGLDVRSDTRAWGANVGGALDPRNDPGAVIFTSRQWLYAGVKLGGRARLQVEEHASYGHGEDDLTRNRAGGMTPYVTPIAGLPWAALLSERLIAAQLSLHLALDADGAHEIGLAVSGGAFNDVRRTGNLDAFGAAVGLMAFADLRFGAWQLHARFGYALPTSFQIDPPHLSGLATVGVRLR
jgi:hypothetical protein